MARSALDEVLGLVRSAGNSASSFLSNVGKTAQRNLNYSAPVVQQYTNRLANDFKQTTSRIADYTLNSGRYSPVAQTRALFQAAPKDVNQFVNTRFTPKGKTFAEIARDIRTNPNNYNIYAQMAGGNMRTGIGPLDYAGQRAGSFVQNRLIRPGVETVKYGRAAYQSPTLKGKAGNLLMGGLTASQYIPAVAAFNMIYDSAKAGNAAQVRNQSLVDRYNAALQGATGEQVPGLGTALTSNQAIESALNKAEPFIMAGTAIAMGGAQLRKALLNGKLKSLFFSPVQRQTQGFHPSEVASLIQSAGKSVPAQLRAMITQAARQAEIQGKNLKFTIEGMQPNRAGKVLLAKPQANVRVEFLERPNTPLLNGNTAPSSGVAPIMPEIPTAPGISAPVVVPRNVPGLTRPASREESITNTALETGIEAGPDVARIINQAPDQNQIIPQVSQAGQVQSPQLPPDVFDFNKQLGQREYQIFNNAYQKAQDVIDVAPEMREVLPPNITGTEAYSRINQVISFGDDPVDLIDDIATGLQKEGYSSIYRPEQKEFVIGDAMAPNQPLEGVPSSTIASPEQGAMFRKSGPPEEGFSVSKEQAREELSRIFSEDEIGFITQNAGEIITPTGELATGKYYNSIISVVENGGQVDSKDLYHEAFHAYVDKFVDRNSYKEALEEAKRTNNFQSASEANEWFAEQFAQFMQGKRAFTGKVTAFFENLLNNIKGLIGKKNQIQEIYYNMMRGKTPDPVGKQVATIDDIMSEIDDLARQVDELAPVVQNTAQELVQTQPEAATLLEAVHNTAKEIVENDPVLAETIVENAPKEEITDLFPETPDITGDIPPIKPLKGKGRKTPDGKILAKKRGATSRFAAGIGRSGRTHLRDSGPAGEDMLNRIENIHSQHDLDAGGALGQYKQAIRGIKNKDFEAKITPALRGEEVTLTPKQQQAVEVIDTLRKQVAEEANNVGLQIRKANGEKEPFIPRDNYFPQVADPKKFKAHREELISYLVDTKQADIEQATNYVDDIISGETEFFVNSSIDPISARQGNLEYSRIYDLPDWSVRNDMAVMGEYLNHAWRRINIARMFGPNNEIGKALLKKVGEQGGDKGMAEKILNAELGITPHTSVTEALAHVRNFERITKLQLSAITNISQFGNPVVQFGVRNTLKGIVDAMSKSGQDYALDVGATFEQYLADLEKAAGTRTNSSRLVAPFLKNMEAALRTVSSNAAKSFVKNKFDEALKDPNGSAARGFDRLGIDISKGYLSEDDLRKAGQMGAYTTQFKAHPINVPPEWLGDWGKTLTQFKAFGYMQSNFLNESVIKEARKMNFMPFIKAVLVFAVLGEVSNDAKALLTGRERPKNIGTRLAENYGASMFGIAYDVFNMINYRDGLTNFILGPGVGTLVDVFDSARALAFNKPENKLKTPLKNVVRRVPYVGSIVSNRLFPSESQESKPKVKLKLPTSTGAQAGVPTAQAGDSVYNDILQDRKITKEEITKLKQDKKAYEQAIKDQEEATGWFGTPFGGPSEQEKLAKIEEYNKKIENIDKVIGLESAFSTKSGPLAQFKTEKSKLEKARSIFEDPSIDEEDKNTIYKALNIDPVRLKYDYLAHQASSDSEPIADYLYQNLEGQDHGFVMQTLALGRQKSLSGKMLATDTVLGKLQERGLISEEEEKALKEFKLDENGKNISAPKKLKVSKPKKLKVAKTKPIKIKVSKIKSVPTISKLPALRTTPLSAGSGLSSRKVAPVRFRGINLGV